jgi:hypothetical protein
VVFASSVLIYLTTDKFLYTIICAYFLSFVFIRRIAPRKFINAQPERFWCQASSLLHPFIARFHKALFCDLMRLSLAEECLIYSPFGFQKPSFYSCGDAGSFTDPVGANLATAHKWLSMIKEGKSLDDVARQDNTLRRRIQRVIQFAFLAPDIVQIILDGRQPIGLTSEWMLRHKLPNEWQDQRALIATL